MAAQPHSIPVSIAAHAPGDGQAEWRLVHMLCFGDDLATEALDAMRAAGLTPGDFTVPALRDYVERAQALDAAGDAVSEISITLGVSDLGLRDTLDSVNRTACDMSLAGGDPVALVARILEASALRRTLSRAHNLNVALHRPGVTLADAQAAMREAVTEVERMAAGARGAAGDGIWRPQTQELSDLMTEELPATRWLVSGVIPEGLLLLAAKPKSGKTTLMCYLCASIAAGAQTMGELTTQRSEALYVAAEDNPRRMQRRMRRMLQGETAPHGFHIEYRWPRLDQGGLQALDAYCVEHPSVGVIVLDTLERVRPARRNGGGYADDYESVADLQSLAARHQVAIVVLHHLRKAAADDPFDEINASMGLLASVDNMIVLRRGQDGVIELHRRGREYDDDEPLALQGDRDTLCWRLVGKLADVVRSDARNDIIALLRQHPTGMTPTEITTALGKNISTVKTLLGRMLDERAPVITASGGRYFADADPPARANARTDRAR